MAIYNYNFDILEKELPEKYYFLGFLAADGSLTNSGIIFELNEKDGYMVKKLNDYICPEKEVAFREKTNSYRASFFNIEMTRKLKEYFSMTSNRKTEEIRFPEVPNEYLRDFIRGIIDGDGNIDSTKGYRGDKIYIGARLRILGNEIFLKELNEKTKLLYPHNTNAVSKKGKENIYVITYNFKTARELLKVIYYDGCLCLKRKFDRTRDEDIVSTLVKTKD